MRKIVQIAVAAESESFYGKLFALCEDGSVWFALLDGSKELDWKVVSPAPGDSSHGEIQFLLHVEGAAAWSWADIRNNGAVTNPNVNPHNEQMDARG
jgi:hypothetical protein